VRGDGGSDRIVAVEQDKDESEKDEEGEECEKYAEVDDEDDEKRVSDGHYSLISTNVHVVTD
jgi:hypothetical protein